MDEAFGVPGGFLLGGVEQRAGLIEIAQAADEGAPGLESGKRIGAGAGEGGEFLRQGRGLDVDQVGLRREVIGDAGGRIGQLEAGRGGEGDGVDGFAGALRHGIEAADLLNLVAEEVEPVGLVGCDRVDVDDATADGVVAGRFTDGLRIIIEFAQLLHQAGEGLGLAAAQDEFPRGEFLEGRDGLQEGGRRGHHDQ